MRFTKNLNCVPRTGTVRRCFTLVELMTVIAILGILVGLVVGGVAVASRKSAEAKIKAQMAMIEITFGNYQRQLGYYPQQATAGPVTRAFLEGLNTAYLASANKPLLDLSQFQFKEISGTIYWVDVWENPFQYQCPGTHNAQTYDLWSYGKDGPSGTTGDDINNWSRN